MNRVKIHNKIGLDYKKSLKEARYFFKKNRLHEALSIISKLKHHGYDDPEMLLFMAEIYNKLTFITSEAEYEEKTIETYEEIIRYSNSQKYIKKAVKLQNLFMKRISEFDENEHKAHNKAEELESSRNMSPKAWYMLGANFSVRKDPFFVINAYSNAVKLNDKYIAALYRLGYVYQYNFNDIKKALGYYLRAIKIKPYEDDIESESTNVKLILLACTEISEIYIADKNYKKAISVFDHAFRILTAYGDICSLHDVRKVMANAYLSSKELDKVSALKNHVKTSFGYDLESLLDELRIG